MKTQTRSLFDYLSFILILVGVIYYRYYILISYSFLYTDSDQCLMWEGLRDYSNFNFYEPRFYGQSYNTFLEALFAVPLYKLNFAPYTALPFVSMLLTLLPFILIAGLTFFKRSVFYALVILSIPLLLSFEYSIITSMPRGFVTGIFIASIGCISIFYSKEKRFFFVASFLSVLAFSINSNSVLISAMCLLYLFLENFNSKKFYLLSGFGLLCGLIPHILSNRFYTQHPFYDLHKFYLSYSTKYFLKGIASMDKFLNFNTPIFWSQGFILLILFVLIALFFFKQKKYSKASVVIFIPLAFIATLGFNKIYQGTESLYFHVSRMYLCMPVLLALALSFFTPRYEPKIYFLYLLVPYHFLQLHFADLEENISKLPYPDFKSVVTVGKVKAVLETCERINKTVQEENADVIICSSHFFGDLVSYGCKSCYENYPKTIYPRYERRTWRLLEDADKVYNTVLIVDFDRKLDTSFSFLKKLPEYDLYLILENKYTTKKIMDTLKIECRKFRQ